MKCEICKKEDYKIDTSKFPKRFCSYKCYGEWQKFNKEPNCFCFICKKEMYLKPSRLKRIKNEITCSIECSSKLKSDYMKGIKNHQYGLIGDKNSSFKDKLIITNYGYALEYCPNHPRPHDISIKGHRVKQHRLIVERNYTKFNTDFFEKINGWIVLKSKYDVHHKNRIKTDNNIENLQVLTRSAHSALHSKENAEIIKKYFKIIGVLKQGELLETPEVDNQQPSLGGNIFEGSETNNRSQTSNVVGSNVNTSALLQQIVEIVEDDIVRTIV